MELCTHNKWRRFNQFYTALAWYIPPLSKSISYMPVIGIIVKNKARILSFTYLEYQENPTTEVYTFSSDKLQTLRTLNCSV